MNEWRMKAASRWIESTPKILTHSRPLIRSASGQFGPSLSLASPRECRRRAEAQGLLHVLHPTARTNRVSSHAFGLVVIRINASLPGRVSADQDETIASGATHSGLQLLPPEPAPAARQEVSAREGSRYRHLERRRFFLTEGQMCASQRYCDAGFRCVRIDGANRWLQLTASKKLDPLLLELLG